MKQATVIMNMDQLIELIGMLVVKQEGELVAEGLLLDLVAHMNIDTESEEFSDLLTAYVAEQDLSPEHIKAILNFIE